MNSSARDAAKWIGVQFGTRFDRIRLPLLRVGLEASPPHAPSQSLFCTRYFHQIVWGEIMLRRLVSTQKEYSLALSRVLLGLVFFAHGAQKMLGWFGGSGFSGTIGQFAQFGMPVLIVLFAIFVEFFGGLSLLFGLFSRVAASAIIVEMIGALLTVHVHNGFFMNWTGQKGGEGFEYHFIAIALALLILVRGAGALSIDYLVSSSGSKSNG